MKNCCCYAPATGLVEQQERESDDAVASYRPTTAAQLDNLTTPAAELLRQLPGVRKVEFAVRVDRPMHRIIHLRAWHFVPRNLFAIDVRNAARRPLAEDTIDRLYEEFLLEVEAVQLEQLALLRCLRKHHGLRRILCEGLTDKDLPTFQEKIAVGRDQTDRYQQTLAIERQLLTLLQDGHLGKSERRSKAVIDPLAVPSSQARPCDFEKGPLVRVAAGESRALAVTRS